MTPSERSLLQTLAGMYSRQYVALLLWLVEQDKARRDAQ